VFFEISTGINGVKFGVPYAVFSEGFALSTGWVCIAIKAGGEGFNCLFSFLVFLIPFPCFCDTSLKEHNNPQSALYPGLVVYMHISG
jgi:hypothetical protein